MRPRLPNLPLDLVIEVLVCLPVETLIKFRCVSKSWRALIDSAQFRQLHLRRIRSWTSAEEQNKFLFRWWGPSSPGEEEDRHYVVDFDSPDKILKKTSALELSCPLQNQNDRLSLKLESPYGTCNGLVCFGYSHPSIHCEEGIVILWNPCIKKYWELPSHPLPKYESKWVHPPSFSFGYDDIADDYKVVRWVSFEDESFDDEDAIYQEAMVYSLKSNCWTSLPQVPYSPPNSIPRSESGILVNCALHWILTGIFQHTVAILALDLRTDKFHCIPLPLEMEMEWEGFTILEALDGCLCLLPEHEPGEPEPFFHVWIMKDYGVKESWVNLIIRLSTFNFKITARFGIHLPHPVAYSQGGTKLFCFHEYGNCVMWYDIEREDWVGATLVNSGSSNMGPVFPFVPSLIEPSPDGAIAISDQNAGIKRVETNLFKPRRKRRRSRARKRRSPPL